MKLLKKQFADFLTANEGRIYQADSGLRFSFSIHNQHADAPFPASIAFSSPQWKTEKPRRMSAKRIAEFLNIFNSGSDNYLNHGPKKSPAFNGKLLEVLMDAAAIHASGKLVG